MAKRVTRPCVPELVEPIRIARHHTTLLEAYMMGMDATAAKERDVKLNADELARGVAESYSKLDLLFDHFGLADPTDYRLLAWRLATEYVPGFRLVRSDAKRQGRPRNDPLDLIRLLVDVEVIKRQKRWVQSDDTDADALREFETKSKFAERWGRYNQRSLQNLLTAARDPEQNPWLHFWNFEGPARKTARDGLIEMFSVTKKGK